MSMMSRLLLCLLLVWPAAARAMELVRFPKPEFEGDHRYDDAMQLLQLGLSKSGVDYRIERAEIPMNQERQVVEIEAGRPLDVGPIPSSAEREAHLETRTVIELKNPLLTVGTPSDRPELWYGFRAQR